MTICPYVLACGKWDCEFERAFNTCFHYEKAENLTSSSRSP
jgi:hypothetical protein